MGEAARIDRLTELRETAAGAALAIVCLIVRAFAFFHWRFDSDEPQHLHVAWGWTAGLVQYHDLFDNHTPLFSMLSAPLLAAIGERADVLLFMRAAMLPLFAAVVAATCVLGRRLYSTRIALWSALILAVNTPFFLKSLEYRNDNLWNALWMLALVVLTGGALTSARTFAVGLILGAALAVSLKTTLFIISIAVAALMTWRQAAGRPPLVRPLISGMAGLALVPAMVSAYLVSAGAWPAFIDCNFRFHELVARTREHIWIGPLAFFPAGLTLLLCVASRNRPADGRETARFFLAVVAAAYIVFLGGFWLIILVRDFLPIFPLLTIFFVAAVIESRRTRAAAASILTVTAVIFIALMIAVGRPFEDQTRAQIALVRQAIELTRPGEMIMDLKGETIFRPRPVYQVYESIARAAIRKGLLPDTIAESVIARRCYVALPDSEFIPQRGRAFLNRNFVSVGQLRVAGQWIASDGSFSIAVPGSYMIVDAAGAVTGPKYLAAGVHHFASAASAAVLWSPAYQRGFSPFHPRRE